MTCIFENDVLVMFTFLRSAGEVGSYTRCSMSSKIGFGVLVLYFITTVEIICPCSVLSVEASTIRWAVSMTLSTILRSSRDCAFP